MKRLVTNLLITTFVIAVGRGEPTGVQNVADQVAQETRPLQPAMQIVEAPKYVAKPDSNLPRQQHFVPLIPKHPPILYQKQKSVYQKQHKTNAPQKYMKVIPLKPHQRAPVPPNVTFYPLKQPTHSFGKSARPPQLMFSASTGRPHYANIQIVKSPKFSLPVQTINGIRAYDVKPPKSTTTTSTTTTTTTTKPKRIKRIWPKRILDKMNGTLSNLTSSETIERSSNVTANSTQTTDQHTSASYRQNKYANRSGITTTTSTTTTQKTPRVYRKVTRKPKVPATTMTSFTSLNLTVNDWVPIMPSHYPNIRRAAPRRRNDIRYGPFTNPPKVADKRRMVYLQTFGVVPIKALGSAPKPKLVMFHQKKRQLNPNVYSGFSGGVIRRPLASGLKHTIAGDLQTAASGRTRVITKIKHHHHHHHHKYIKTVEKKVPFKVEVPKPYPVEKKVPFPVEKIVEKIVEKKVPYPVPVEKKVPYKVEVKVPQPYPVKVIEKEYISRPFPVIQHVQVPVTKTVEVKVPHPVPVPVQVEKRVPYPVHVKVPVPVDRPVPYPVTVEKKVPVPYPVKMYVPQPYPVEKRVPYPVEVKVKEPVEVIKHVPVKVYVPKPYPVRVPHPYPVHVEKRVPYPVEVEKKVPVPMKVYVPHPVPVQVEKRVPVYLTKHVPVAVAAAVPLDTHVVDFDGPVSKQNVQVITARPEVEHVVRSGLTVQDNYVTDSPPYTVTVHGNGHFNGFTDRGGATPASKS